MALTGTTGTPFLSAFEISLDFERAFRVVPLGVRGGLIDERENSKKLALLDQGASSASSEKPQFRRPLNWHPFRLAYGLAPNWHRRGSLKEAIRKYLTVPEYPTSKVGR